MAEGKTAVVEEVKNCPACKKPMKKARRYYRNGSYYCSNNCFKKVEPQLKEAKEKAKAEAAQAKAAAAETKEEAKG